MSETDADTIRQHRHVGAYALIYRDGLTLLTLKARGPYTGTWDLPGGGLEHGESPEEALLREVTEETGLYLNGVQLLATASNRVTYQLGSGGWEDLHHVGFIYLGTLKPTGQLRVGPDGVDTLGSRWFSLSEVRSLPLSPFAKRALVQEFKG